MDWITVATEGLPTIDFEKHSVGANHQDTINLMQYINLIDVLVESVKQIYRVLDNQDSYPLKNEKNIFRQINISDDKYFTHIRAVFSAHPVNLNSKDGYAVSQKNEKFFASFVARNRTSSDGLPEDFYVMLYTNIADGKRSSLGINMNQLNKYCESRYSLLIDLISKVKLIKS